MDLFKSIIVKLNIIYENVEALIGSVNCIEKYKKKKKQNVNEMPKLSDFKTISIKFQYSILMPTTNCYAINFVSIGKKIGY